MDRRLQRQRELQRRDERRAVGRGRIRPGAEILALGLTAGNGSGTVTSSPAGINCGSDCEKAYEQGTKVTLSPGAGIGL